MDPQTITVQLRPGWKIEILLPGDLTPTEAETLGNAIKAAATFPDNPSSN